MLEQKDFEMLRQMIGDVVEEKLEQKLEEKLEQKFNEKLAPIENRLQKFDENFVQIENRLQKSDENFVQIENRLQNLEEMDKMILDEVVRVHEYASDSIGELRAEIQELKRYQRLSNDNEELRQRVEKLEIKIKELEAKTA